MEISKSGALLAPRKLALDISQLKAWTDERDRFEREFGAYAPPQSLKT